MESDFQIAFDECLILQDRICVPKDTELIQKILHEAHSGYLSVHPAQKHDSDLQAKRAQCESRMESDFQIAFDECLILQDRICVPKDTELIQKILHEAHSGYLSVHPGSTKMDNDLKKLLHGVPISIISDKDLRFTLRLWKKLQEALGTKLNFSIAFHLQTNGQFERVIQILKDMLRCCNLEFEGSSEKYLPLVKFAYDNSFQSSLKMTPFEA
ncbi:uncharacterized protein LOC128293783 [Gossypium arboreum]|uniref:uncharacterized protein LOC128293783 n=1 Tax=Gossypium arboreum TaxID=29729 RepID=UPI0022F169F7|nr:uncharacterized protein LOC128293783 [Gossypium arboreum]